ncbi:RHS repeat-associated protein [Nocardia pseudobrasiliensis]|uniref:RHS repeat-associated protein n=2 Tax=Nocardia pseudobrasiliensis TaxID=45979 RepID=A0A370ICI5_9NOCA|nr:RHS repeat-associated protein [Nocardia pseudobrasiliensis]
MGARTYLPVLGRFLQVDPVAGGSANDYDYVNGDPINSFDLAGTISWSGVVDIATNAAEVASFVPGPIGTVAAGVATAGQLAQGNYAAAAADAVGMIPGGKLAGSIVKGVEKEAPAVEKAVEKTSFVGPKNYSEYQDVTKGNSVPNRKTDTTRGSFERNLEQSGWEKPRKEDPRM